MVSIGFNTASIGLMVAIMSLVMLVVETPSGILADRWSRKGVAILGCAALLIGSVVGALSFNELVYLLSAVFWGIYSALYSGAYDAMIYDTAVEEDGDSHKFQYYLGRLRAIQGASFVIGALVGGLIASTLAMRDTYIFSIPFIALAFFFLWKFREPQLHKAEVAQPVFKHIRQTFAAVLKNPVLLPVVIATVGFGVLQETVFELTQLWFIAVATPIALYGLFSAVVYSSWTIGGSLAARIKSKPATITIMTALLIAVAGLILTRHFWLILAAQFVLAICLVALSVILAKRMHDELPSRLRAGSASVVSTLARILIIPETLVFTAVANNRSIFSATYILLGVAVVSIAAYLFISPVKKGSLSLQTKDLQ